MKGMEKDLDIVIYGATGFTGRLCFHYLMNNSDGIKLAIAGRDEKKLKEILEELGKDAEILVADGDDRKALDKVTSRSRVIISTAGPFHKYSSKLVASCEQICGI